MIDKEKVISGLHDIGHDIGEFIVRRIGVEQARNFLRKIDDAVELLKEQDAEISRVSNKYLALVGKASKKPTIVRCKDCKHRPKKPDLGTYESGFDLEFPEGSKCPCRCCGDEWYSWYPEDNWFCADGERK